MWLTDFNHIIIPALEMRALLIALKLLDYKNVFLTSKYGFELELTFLKTHIISNVTVSFFGYLSFPWVKLFASDAMFH